MLELRPVPDKYSAATLNLRQSLFITLREYNYFSSFMKAITMRHLYILFLMLSCGFVFTTVAGKNLRASEQKFSEESISYDFALGLLKRGLNSEAAVEFAKFLARYPNSEKYNPALLNRAEALFNARDFTNAARTYYDYLTRSRSTDRAPRLRYGICLYELKEYQSALETLQPLLKDKDQISQSATYYYALSLQKTGDKTQAGKLLLEVNSKNLRPLALYSLAEILLEDKKYKEAANYLGELIEQYPDHHLREKARLVRANALRLGGELAASSGDFNMLLDSPDPKLRLRARYGLAWSLYGEDKLAQAKAQLAEISKDPKEFAGGANYLLGSIAFKEKDYLNATEYYKKVTTGEFAPKAGLASAWAYYNNKNYASTINQITAISEKFPDFAEQELHYLAGRALWQLTKFKEAADEFSYALKFKGERSKQAAYELALALQQSGQYQPAADAFNSFITNYPDDKELTLSARAGLGSTLMQQGRYEATIPVYISLIKETPENNPQRPSFLSRLAVCYYYLKQYKNMALTYQKLLNQYPNDPQIPDALFWLGWQGNNSANYNQAIKYFTTLMQKYPTSKLTPKGKYFLGLTYLKAGDNKNAANIFYEIATGNKQKINEQELLWLAQYFSAQANYDKAKTIYNLLLKGDNKSLIYAVALRGTAQIYQKQQLWQQSFDSFQKLLEATAKVQGKTEIISALKNEAYFGIALSLRHLKKYQQARAALDKIKIADDDPFAARIFYELGFLDFVEDNYQSAVSNLMRVGLLVEDEELAGSALLKAAEACEKLNDTAKAKICYQELAGNFEGSYGRIFPKSRYTQTGKEKLKNLNAVNRATPASGN